MKIAVIGAGNVGAALGRRWAEKGHKVIFGSRDPAHSRFEELLPACHGNASVASTTEAVGECDIVVLAAPWLAAEETLGLVENWQGKILIDCVNPINAQFTGLDLGFTTSGSEQIADWAPGARVVKAFNTISAATMGDADYGEHQASMLYCGDDDEAKQTLHELAEQLGLEAIDAGELAMARYLEPLAMLYIKLAIKQGWGGNSAFKILKR